MHWDGAGDRLDQLQLFSGAETVLGFHGGGLANAAFSRYACVHELSTFRTLDTDERGVLWASNRAAVVQHAKTLSWHIHLLPLNQLLEQNRGINVNVTRIREQLRSGSEFTGQISMYRIGLSEVQVQALKDELSSCTLAWTTMSGGIPPHSQKLLAGSRTDWPAW